MRRDSLKNRRRIELESLRISQRQRKRWKNNKLRFHLNSRKEINKSSWTLSNRCLINLDAIRKKDSVRRSRVAKFIMSLLNHKVPRVLNLLNMALRLWKHYTQRIVSQVLQRHASRLARFTSLMSSKTEMKRNSKRLICQTKLSRRELARSPVVSIY
jgi:hypothetical protein